MNLRAKFVFLIGLPGLLCLLPSSARADAIYTYTGNPFTGCGGEGVTTYVCNGTTPALSITVDIAKPLGDNLNLKNIDNRLVSIDVTDGTGLEITLDDASGGTFEFSTDSLGNITEWSIEVETTPTAADLVAYSASSFNFGGGDNKDNSQTTVDVVNNRGKLIETTFGVGENDGTALISTFASADPGMWTVVSTSQVTEPSSVVLFITGLLGVAKFRARSPHRQIRSGGTYASYRKGGI